MKKLTRILALCLLLVLALFRLELLDLSVDYRALLFGIRFINRFLEFLFPHGKIHAFELFESRALIIDALLKHQYSECHT